MSFGAKEMYVAGCLLCLGKSMSIVGIKASPSRTTMVKKVTFNKHLHRHPMALMITLKMVGLVMECLFCQSGRRLKCFHLFLPQMTRRSDELDYSLKLKDVFYFWALDSQSMSFSE